MNSLKNISKKIFAGMSVLFVLMIIGIFFGVCIPANAQGGISVKEVNYDKSIIVIELTGNDSRLYISDAKMKKWEYVPVTRSDEGTITFDISWISPSKDYTLSIKGDITTDPIQIVIPKQVNNFKASYDVSSQSVTYVNDEGRTIQWKKKNGYRWTNIESTAQSNSVFSNLIANGAVILFRLAPVNGSGTDGGMRPGKEVSVTIPKKTAAPKITVNDTIMAIPVVKGLEYRYINEDGTPLESGAWTVFDKAENKPLSEIAPKAVFTGQVGNDGTYPENTDTQAQYIQFRTQASGSKQMSNTTTVKIPAQEVLTKEEIDSFVFEYRSSASFAIKVTGASSEKPYEYCIINKKDIDEGVTIDNAEKLKWKEISSSGEIGISKTKDSCEDGSRIYIRRKAYKSLGEEDYKLASNAFLLSTVTYPGDVTADSVYEIHSIAGVCRSNNVDGQISFSFFSPSNGAITKLKFVDSDDNMKELGSADFKSEVTKNENEDQSKEGDEYIINTIIYSTSALESLLPADEDSITLTGQYCIGNDSEFCSSSKSLVKLTLHRASKVIVPDETLKEKLKQIQGLTDADRIGYTKNIKRVYMSERIYGEGYTDDADQDIFRTVVKIGDPGRSNSVTGIQYDGITISGDLYRQYPILEVENGDDSDHYLVIEFNVAEIEKNDNISSLDKSLPVTILFNSGEKLNDVTITLMSSAKLKQGSIGTSFNPDIIEAKQTVSTIENGVVTSTTEGPNRDYYIEYEVNIADYPNLMVLNATYFGQSIMLESDPAKGRVYLSVQLIKDYVANNWIDTTKTGNVEIIFNNGFKITKGYSLTLLR